MKKVVINQNQKGLLFRNGKFQGLLNAGKYYVFGGREIIMQTLDRPLYCDRCPLDTLLQNQEIQNQTSVVEVGDNQLALHFVDGMFSAALPTGKHAFWNGWGHHEFRIVDISTPHVDETVPAYIFSAIPISLYTKVEVAEHQKALLYFDRKLEKVLDAGTYYFWKTPVRITVEAVDTRLTQMNIQGQELLTADKVTLRVSVALNYRVTNPVRIRSEVDDFAEQLHVATQLALREYVGRCKLDEILENKEDMSHFVFERLKAKETALFVEITEAGVKDIILPGEIREIMNTVLVAEKRAQANVITRREEVASTRSLLNTAKLMEENPTLCRLKEMEFVERICENVGTITLNGSSDLLTQLASVLRPKDA